MLVKRHTSLDKVSTEPKYYPVKYLAFSANILTPTVAAQSWLLQYLPPGQNLVLILSINSQPLQNYFTYSSNHLYNLQSTILFMSFGHLHLELQLLTSQHLMCQTNLTFWNFYSLYEHCQAANNQRQVWKKIPNPQFSTRHLASFFYINLNKPLLDLFSQHPLFLLSYQG